MTHAEIVRKLIGEIMPVGETNEDQKRFNNLIEMAGLVDILLEDISKVVRRNVDAKEHSVVKARTYAKEFLTQIGITED